MYAVSQRSQALEMLPIVPQFSPCSYLQTGGTPGLHGNVHNIIPPCKRQQQDQQQLECPRKHQPHDIPLPDLVTTPEAKTTIVRIYE